MQENTMHVYIVESNYFLTNPVCLCNDCLTDTFGPISLPVDSKEMMTTFTTTGIYVSVHVAPAGSSCVDCRRRQE